MTSFELNVARVHRAGLCIAAAGWLTALLMAPAARAADPGVPNARSAAGSGLAGIGTAIFRGMGCPPATARASLGSDGRTVVVVLDSAEATTLGAPGQVYMTCNITVPVQAAPGTSLALEQIDLLAVSSIPPGGRGTITREYAFGGSKGRAVAPFELGPTSGAVAISDVFVPETVTAPVCGGTVAVRANVTIVAAPAPGSTVPAIAALDAAGSPGAVVFTFAVAPCAPGAL